MAIERNNTALEFETMLRRHLKSGGATVAACAGFDFDTASAYLEDALGGSERAHYESHLAGCAACRRHLIELSRLAQAIPHAGTRPATVADQAPAWTPAGIRWREVVANWFDLSGWNWKWQMIGAAGAAFAVLIAALGVQSWRQESKHSDIATSATVNPATQHDLGVQTPQSPTPEASPAGSPVIVAENLVADQQRQSRVSVPTPPVGPKDGDLAVAVEPKTESLKLNSTQPSMAPSLESKTRQEAPAEAQRNRIEVQQNPAPQPGIIAVLDDNSDNANRRVLAKEQVADSPVQAERTELRNDITARITPPPGTNPMNSEPKPRSARGKAQPEKSSAPSRLYEIANTFARRDKSKESGRKAEPEPLDDESFKPLTVRIRDKVFRFEGNMWIDQAYKPGMQWRVLKLTRGGKQYEQVLSEEPLLKEFFDQGPIILIWKDKIYKVR